MQPIHVLIAVLTAIALFAAWGFWNKPAAQSPCNVPGTWQTSAPRIGHPDDLRSPLACIEVDGTLRCQ